MSPLITSSTRIDDSALLAIAHLPTRSLPAVVEPAFFARLSDAHFMRIAVFLAHKSFEEGGCPIGAVIIDNASRQIVGKGHNTLVQENHPYNHGETSAIRDAGRLDFSATTIFTTLTPCDVCATLIRMRGFARVVVGNILDGRGNESALRGQGIVVDVIEDSLGIDLYARYAREKPNQNLEDWQGLAAVKRAATHG